LLVNEYTKSILNATDRYLAQPQDVPAS